MVMSPDVLAASTGDRRRRVALGEQRLERVLQRGLRRHQSRLPVRRCPARRSPPASCAGVDPPERAVAVVEDQPPVGVLLRERPARSATGRPAYAVGTSVSSTSRTRISVSCLSEAAPPPTNPATMSLAGFARIASGVSYCRIVRLIAQHGDPIAELHRLVEVVGDEHDGLAELGCRRISSSCNRPRVIGSTAPNGSSISSTGGSAASARATPTRCC